MRCPAGQASSRPSSRRGSWRRSTPHPADLRPGVPTRRGTLPAPFPADAPAVRTSCLTPAPRACPSEATGRRRPGRDCLEHCRTGETARTGPRRSRKMAPADSTAAAYLAEVAYVTRWPLRTSSATTGSVGFTCPVAGRQTNAKCMAYSSAGQRQDHRTRLKTDEPVEIPACRLGRGCCRRPAARGLRSERRSG